jgi:hypothetical protein
MSDLQRRSSSRPSRRQREAQAYRLVMATSVLGVAGVVGLVLAVVGVISIGLPIVLLVIAAALAFYLRRTLAP